MAGVLLDQKGNKMDPCEDYMPSQCPTKRSAGFAVSFGAKGVRDIIPLATILRAAGANLEATAKDLEGDVESARHAGVVIACSIKYSNDASFNTAAVAYLMTCNQ